MKKILRNQKFIFLVLILSLFCLVGTTYAVNNSSSVKIGRASYSPGMSVGSIPPSMQCSFI